jgi:hypothetical protein
MQAQEWRGCVDLLGQDGTSFGPAVAHLYARPSIAGRTAWHGTLHAGVGPQTRPWPADELVLVRGVSGQDVTMCLRSALVEQGPVLFQVASVWAILPTG